MANAWSKPWCARAQVTIGDRKPDFWGARGGVYKRISRSINVASCAQEAVLISLHYKNRCGTCGRIVNDCK